MAGSKQLARGFLVRFCRTLSGNACALAIIAAASLLAGCQSPATRDQASPVLSGVIPAGLLQTLTGRPVGADASEETSVARPLLPEYPVARWLNNDKWIPSNDRDWVAEHRVLPTAEFGSEGEVTVRNIRNAEWLTAADCLVDHYDKTYDLRDLQTLDFLVVPFETRSIAHTMLSFGFGQGDYLGISVEVRVEQGEAYNAALGLARQFEIIYVVADERDLLPVRVKHRKADVYVYRTTATPEQTQAMFRDVMQRVNGLAEKPEFYDTFSNNCTTNIVRHVNALSPGRVPFDLRVLLPGYSDQLAYELGLLDRRLPFAEIKRRAWANERILKHEHAPDFSARIRR
jgi:hypothetical protein